MIKPLNTKDIIYLKLKKEIIEGILAPDSDLIEGSLSKRYEVSRTPLREAFQHLEVEGWIVKKTNGRYKVSQISEKEVREIFEIRSRLEGLVASEASKNATQEDINYLKNITDLIIGAAKKDQHHEVIRYGSEFHSYLYKLSNHQTAIKIIKQFNDHIDRYRRFGPTLKSHRSISAAYEHLQVFEFISIGDHENARKSMETHISNSLNSAIETIRNYLSSHQVKEKQE